MMSAADVCAVMDAVAQAGCKVWLDGGWAVDAALGEETREHDNIDLVGELADVANVADALGAPGYRLTLDERPVRVVYESGGGRSVDFHTVVFDEGGGGIQGLPGGGTCRYPPAGFAGTGNIGGRNFPCLTPEVQVLFCHQGYEPDEKDRHDITLLCSRFGIELPAAYR
jgi:lincosamide nucleotidyltransferase A/C/D/E